MTTTQNQFQSKADWIRFFNDAYRSTIPHSQDLNLAPYFLEEFKDHLPEVYEAIQQFDSFNEDNDPYREHDYGRLTVRGTEVWWKIDYYDFHLQNHSPDPADPSVTRRVMTIGIPEDY